MLTCAGAADDAVVDDGAAVDGDLQAVVGVVVLSGFVVGVELQQSGRETAPNQKRESGRGGG